MLTETACSRSYKGQGENNSGTSYLLKQCHFYHYQRILGGLKKRGGGDKGSEKSEPWIITPVYLTYKRAECASLSLIKDVLSI